MYSKQIRRISKFFLVSLYSMHSVLADTEVVLPPIIKEGTPADILIEDPIVPSIRGQVRFNSSTGSLQNTLEDQLDVPIIGYGKGGAFSQARGLGPSAEEVDVQAFGISLNPPQGGGFDLSIFPQFLWSDFSFQAGPSLNLLNPSASSGTLTLMPWTLTALSDSGKATHVYEAYSSLGLNQIAVGYRKNQVVAGLAGYSTGITQGPSLGLSTRWETPKYRGTFNLLFTDLTSESAGSTSFPSPNAKIHNIRVIPLIQNDFQLSSFQTLKTSVYFDWSHIGFSDPDVPFESKNYSRQWGFESAYEANSWTAGLVLRQTQFSNDLASPPTQTYFQGQISRVFDFDSAFLEPTLQGVWVEGYGFLPQGSVGYRKEWNTKYPALFSRVSFSRRVPSLLDRFSALSPSNQPDTFIGNPAIQTELDWTWILGAETKLSSLFLQIQGYAQYKQNPRVRIGSTISNLSEGWVFSLDTTQKWALSKRIDLSHSIRLSRSQLAAVGVEFPYFPNLIDLLGFRLHFDEKFPGWEWGVFARTVGSRVFQPQTGERLPGYFTVDTHVKFNLNASLSFLARVENCFDRNFELIQGYPIGRAFSLMLTGDLQGI